MSVKMQPPQDARICLTMQGDMRFLVLFSSKEDKSMARMVKKKAAKKVSKAKPPAKSAKRAKPAARKIAGLSVGASVPSFAMPATVAGQVSAAKLKGKPFVLYFYPKDDTSGCTAEACGFQEALPALGKSGLTVIGVSKDDL